MTGLRRSRPWPVRLFAALFLLAAAIRLAIGLIDLTPMVATLFNWLPWTQITFDMARVALFAEFTIACIPVALVWFRALRVARILVAVMAGLRLLAFDVSLLPPAWLFDEFALGLSLLAAGLLFTPPANRYFSGRGSSDAKTFD